MHLSTKGVQSRLLLSFFKRATVILSTKHIVTLFSSERIHLTMPGRTLGHCALWRTAHNDTDMQTY